MKNKTKETDKKENIPETKHNNKKALIISLIIITLVIVTVVVVYAVQKQNQQNEPKGENNQTEMRDKHSLIDMNNTTNVDIIDEEKVNNSQALIAEKEYKGMKITGVNLATSDGVTNFTATVENVTDNDFEGEIVTLVFINQDGSEYGRLEVSIPRVKKGGVTGINAGTTADLSNAYDFRIE